jgi:prophage tail gpP-like protein
MARSLLGSPYATDRTPRVTIVIDDQEYDRVADYSYDTDLLTLGDAFAVSIPDPNLRYRGLPKMGQLVELFMEDPDVDGGAKVRKLKGRVTRRRRKSVQGQGTVISVAGADLGWHLIATDAPMWFRLNGATFDQLLERVLDSSWDIVGVRAENDTNRKLKLGRAGVAQQITPSVKAFIPPIQTDVGQKIADVLIEFARREKKLVNVSSDGYLQIFSPKYNQPARYVFEFHSVSDRRRNNVEAAEEEESIDEQHTDVTCVWNVIRPPTTTDATNPNEGRQRARYKPSPPPLPFNRRLTFSDGDALSQEMGERRALWRYQRGIFDSWTYTITVKGHSQNGFFFEPDTIAEVHDTVNGVDGRFYVARVRYDRNRREGTISQLTLKRPDLLGA